MDSTRKETRNRQWEKAIGETRADIEATNIDQERRLASLMAANGDKQPAQEIQQSLIRQTFITRWSDVLMWATSKHKERVADGFQDWRGIPLERLQELTTFQLEELLSNKGILYRFYGGDDCLNLIPNAPGKALTTKKLRTQEWSILKLVIRLLFHYPIDSNANESSLEVLKARLSWDREKWNQTLQDTDRHLSILKAEGQHSALYDTFQSPQCPRYEYSPNQKIEELKTFNCQVLRTALQKVSSSSTVKLAVVCERLLNLRIAPDIHTYNLLLVRFCQLGEVSLVYAVLESIRETHVRPNEITNATMLRFFIATNNAAGFRWYIRMMDGYRQGLALADPDQNIHPIARTRYRWFGREKQKIAEKARMNEDVYTVLIVGAIRFLGRRHAMFYYKKMIREGWRPTAEILAAVLQQCYDFGDLNSGWRVFRLLRSLKLTCDRASVAAYDWIEKLCQRCGKSEAHEYVLMKRAEDGIPPVDPHEEVADIGKPDAKGLCTNNGPVRLSNTATITNSKLRLKFPTLSDEVRRDLLQKVQNHSNPWERLSELIEIHREISWLKRAVSRNENSLKKLAQDLADLTGEVAQISRLQDVDVIKYGVSARITSLEREAETDVVRRAYKAIQLLQDCPAQSKESSDNNAWSRSGSQQPAIAPPWMTDDRGQLPVSAG